MGTPVEYPRRVAMVSLHTSPLATPGMGDAGGLNVYVSELSRRLSERGVAVDVFTRAEDEGPDVIEVGERTRVIQVVAGPREPVAKEDLPALLPEFAAALQRGLGGHEMLHSHYWLSGLVALEVARQSGLPLVHTMHTMARVKNSALGAGQAGEPDVRERGEADVVAGADVLTANTTAEAAELQEHYAASPDAIVVVPPGVDLHSFHACQQPASRAQLGIDADRQVVLFVGRVQPLKAPDVVIRAVAELVRRDPARRRQLRLIIVGSPSGPQAAWARSLGPLAAELGISELVELRPHSPRAELFRWYCASDVVAVPSYNESFGLVALEAQACGRPVVATDVGGLRHAVRDGHTGVLVPGHEPDAWATALAAVLDDARERERMGANAAAHASRFSWDNTAAATLGAYHAAQVRRAARG